MFPTLYFALYYKYFTSTNNALPTIDKANNRILPYCLNTPLATYPKGTFLSTHHAISHLQPLKYECPLAIPSTVHNHHNTSKPLITIKVRL